MMDSDNTNGGRETAPFPTPANRTGTGATNTRAHARVLAPNSGAWVSIGYGDKSFAIPINALAPLLDEMTEAYRIACEHGLIGEAGNGAS
ncbi:MAG: hypothetical protein IOC63_20275 [Methylobacterium sp.]|nr:hypothetical protein [Rhodocyclaceae bacterium]MCA3596224.1 hypothetical protein [Methylobacterium sp.]MCA3602607.1 hypothetical protein [Methylobacterium sp.]MCA3613675.1 hypothetical protein [Methylobacterium sp.]MCA3644141.1 hypothetical protein [Methylobacterium sp.]